MVLCLPVIVCTLRFSMANYFHNWFLEVARAYQDLEELLAPATIQYVQRVGRREPMAFYVFFLVRESEERL